MAEWFKAHAWKACILEMESRVRIPSSLQFFAKSYSGSTETIEIGQCDNKSKCDNMIELEVSTDWKEYMISLKDFENLGIDMSNITSAFLVKAKSGTDIGLSNIRLE